VIGFGLYLVASLALWSEAKSEMLPVIGAGYVMSRSLSGLSVMVFPSAKKDGLGRTFQEQAHRKRVAVVMVCWFFAALAVMLMTSVQMGAAALCTALLVFWYYHHMAMKQFGGMTGDLAGYFLQLAELLILAAVIVAGGAL
jgi:adenosylcobinamide-GDP ribazoletransferase